MESTLRSWNRPIPYYQNLLFSVASGDGQVWPYLPNHVVGTVHIKDDELEVRKRHGEILSELRNELAVLAQCYHDGQILLVCVASKRW